MGFHKTMTGVVKLNAINGNLKTYMHTAKFTLMGIVYLISSSGNSHWWEFTNDVNLLIPTMGFTNDINVFL